MPLPPENPGMGGTGINSKWIIAGVVVLGVLAYYIWNRQSKNSNAPSSNGPSALNVNAELAPVSSQDQWPQNQLVGMNMLALPGTQSDDIAQQLYLAGQAQGAPTNG